jgi:exodeoxyribonuclease VII large subunit
LTLPFGEPTYSVSVLCEEVRDFLAEAFSACWVAGEVQRVRRSQRGHLYFELIEKGDGDAVTAKLDAVLWRTDHDRVRRQLTASGQEIAEGQQMRCRGGIDFYPAGGRLQFVVREVDPVFTLGHLEQRRRETLTALAAAGLLEANAALALSALPLSIGLVTSEDSAAYHDFLSVLQASGYGFRVLFVHAGVQGAAAGRQLASALAALAAEHAAGRRLDCVALIRGGGSRTDMAVFDSREVAEAVATAPFPVLTGLGHQIDRSIADRVAHTELTTPTKVAEHLVARIAAAEARLEELRADLRAAALVPLEGVRGTLAALEAAARRAALRRVAAARTDVERQSWSLARGASGRMRASRQRCAELAAQLAHAPRRLLRRRAEAPEALAHRLVDLTHGRLRTLEAALTGIDRLCREVAPQRTLERGFTLTRAEDGRLVRQAAGLAAGDRITTQTADGSLVSRVEIS